MFSPFSEVDGVIAALAEASKAQNSIVFIMQIDGDLGTGLYNMAGRAYPNIAALATHGVYGLNGDVHIAGGTSMSLPIVAGMFNLINEIASLLVSLLLVL